MSEQPDKNASVKEVPAWPEKAKRKSKTLLIILSVLFVLATLLAVGGYDVWRVVFNPPLVRQMLEDEFVESPLITRVLEDISIRRAQERITKGESLSGVNEPDIVLLISFVDYEQWDVIKDLVVTDDFVLHLISVSVDGLYTWLDSPDPAPTFVWEMAPLKDRLVGQEGAQAILVAYGTLPECTDQEIADFRSRLAAMPPGVEVLYNLCQFPEPWQTDQIDDYVHALVDVNQNVPAAYDFNRMLGGTAAASAATGLVKAGLRGVRILGPFLWIAPLVLLALIAAIGVRSLRDAGRWLGIPLTVSGGLVVCGMFLTRALLLNLLIRRIGAETSTLLRAEVTRSFTRLSGYVCDPMLIQGLILLGAGALLIAAWAVWGRKHKPEDNTPT